MMSIRHTVEPGQATPLEPDPVLDAARESILAVGFRRTTLTDVARRAGVSRMTIYRRFADMKALLADLPGGLWGALLLVMLAMFLLGFVLDFIEIVFVVVPIVAPALLALGADPVWLGVLMAIKLQTSFLTPPFGFSLFYLRGVAPPSVRTGAIYRGVVPFIALQLLMLAVLMAWPALATWLPGVLYR